MSEMMDDAGFGENAGTELDAAREYAQQPVEVGVDPDAVAATPEPPPAATEAEPSGEPAAPTWTGPTEDDWQQLQAQIQSLMPAATEYEQPADPLERIGELDQFSETYADDLRQIIGDAIEQAAAPAHQVAQERAEERAQQWVDQELNSVAEKLGPGPTGEFDKNLTMLLGAGHRAADRSLEPAKALTQAAEQIRAREQAAYDAGRKSVETEWAAKGNAVREPGTGGAPVDGPPPAGDEVAAARQFMATLHGR